MNKPAVHDIEAQRARYKLEAVLATELAAEFSGGEVDGVNGVSISKPLMLSAKSKTDISREGDPSQPPLQFSSPVLRVSMPPILVPIK